jgi:hypothetical protein
MMPAIPLAGTDDDKLAIWQLRDGRHLAEDRTPDLTP